MNWVLCKMPEDFKMIGCPASLVWAVQGVLKGNLSWSSQAKWHPRPQRPGLWGTKDAAPCAMSSIPSQHVEAPGWIWQSQHCSRLLAGWARRDDGHLWLKDYLTKLKKLREETILHTFFFEGLKIPKSAFRKAGEEERILRNPQNMIKSFCRELMKCFCSFLDPTGF